MWRIPTLSNSQTINITVTSEIVGSQLDSSVIWVFQDPPKDARALAALGLFLIGLHLPVPLAIGLVYGFSLYVTRQYRKDKKKRSWKILEEIQIPSNDRTQETRKKDWDSNFRKDSMDGEKNGENY